ncbi:SEC-C metal-binding domain-containing protein [Novosphingobium subterraneum]|uniref:SEC-C metal-binding domain-containing protein n=1 Tax=Novosphingobium subterraneum TaxID=48936 RepID=UPI003D088B6B
MSVELLERLGRQDPCPCGSGKRFQGLLPAFRPFRRHAAARLLAVRISPQRAGTSRPVRAPAGQGGAFRHRGSTSWT